MVGNTAPGQLATLHRGGWQRPNGVDCSTCESGMPSLSMSSVHMVEVSGGGLIPRRCGFGGGVVSGPSSVEDKLVKGDKHCSITEEEGKKGHQT